MQTHVRAHLSLYQTESGMVRLHYWYDTGTMVTLPATSPFSPNPLEWQRLRKTAEDVLSVGITACEEYCPF